MENRLTVLASKLIVNTYASKTGGAAREVKQFECKCVLHLSDGSIDVGTVRIPDALAPEGVAPGDYLISYRAGRSWNEDRIVGVMDTFVAVKKLVPSSPAAGSAPKS